MTKKSSLLRSPLLAGLLLALLSACSTTPNQAPVIDRNVVPAPAPKPATPSESAQVARDESGMYTVKKGDTLIRIALEYGQNYRDIAAWNNLANPDDIKVDQVLRVAPPNSSGPGVQTAAVAMPPSTTAAAPAAPAAPKKTAPKGDKRPYTEANLAEMQRSDNGKPEQVASINPAPAAAVPPAAVPAPAPAAPADEKISWMWPADGKVIATFDEGKNKGVDIAGKAGQQVVAAGAGKVMYAGSGIRGYGNLVIVKHSDTLLSAYAHNRTILVKEGQTVNKGQMIAEMGDSDTDTVKLHFEIRQLGKPVDPSRFLPNR